MKDKIIEVMDSYNYKLVDQGSEDGEFSLVFVGPLLEEEQYVEILEKLVAINEDLEYMAMMQEDGSVMFAVFGEE